MPSGKTSGAELKYPEHKARCQKSGYEQCTERKKDI